MWLILLAFLILGLLGGIIDAFIWGDRKKDPQWLRPNIDYFWLIGLGCVVPILFLLAGRYTEQISLLKVLIGFIGAGIGGSVVWDLVFCKIERGKWLAGAWWWFWIPNKFRIGFKKGELLIFHIIRLLIMTLIIFWFIGC